MPSHKLSKFEKFPQMVQFAISTDLVSPIEWQNFKIKCECPSEISKLFASSSDMKTSKTFFDARTKIIEIKNSVPLIQFLKNTKVLSLANNRT